MKKLYNTPEQAQWVAYKSDLIRYDDQTGKYYIEVDGMRFRDKSFEVTHTWDKPTHLPDNHPALEDIPEIKYLEGEE